MKICTFLFLLLAFQACQKESQDIEIKDVKLSNGILQFKDKEVFIYYASNPDKLNKLHFDSYYNAFKNEVAKINTEFEKSNNLSFNKKILMLKKIGNEEYLEPIIPELYLQKILSKEGEVIIGNYIHKYEEDHISHTSIENYNFITKEFKIKPEKTTIIRQNTKRDIAQCDQDFQSNRRLTGEFQRTINPLILFSSAEVLTKSRRKVLGVWLYTQASSLNMSGQVTSIQLLSVTSPVNVSGSCTSCSSVGQVIHTVVGTDYITDLTGTVSFSGVYNSNPASCVITN